MGYVKRATSETFSCGLQSARGFDEMYDPLLPLRVCRDRRAPPVSRYEPSFEPSRARDLST